MVCGPSFSTGWMLKHTSNVVRHSKLPDSATDSELLQWTFETSDSLKVAGPYRLGPATHYNILRISDRTEPL